MLPQRRGVLHLREDKLLVDRGDGGWHPRNRHITPLLPNPDSALQKPAKTYIFGISLLILGFCLLSISLNWSIHNLELLLLLLI